MGDCRRLKRVMPGELENAGKYGPLGKKEERTDCAAEGRRVFAFTGDWSTTALDPGVS